MPTRLLSDTITTSEKLSKLTYFERWFFACLIVTTDDYGRYDARPKLLSARCFPLEDVPIADISSAISSMQKVNLITLYSYQGKDYLQITKWEEHQRIRNQRSKFPSPNDGELQTFDSEPPTNDGEDEEGTPIPNSEIDLINHLCLIRNSFLSLCPSLPAPMDIPSWTSKRKSAVLNCGLTVEAIQTLFKRVEKSDFLTGRNGKWQGCSIDWIFKSENMSKIIEGNFDNKEKQAKNANSGMQLHTKAEEENSNEEWDGKKWVLKKKKK